tara:strand:+ start:5346 stop:5564 length:219 start_codon:yes stop_codon:yes gene_type:complete
MATKQTFVIEYGLSVGSSEVINSSGKIVPGALSNVDTDDIAEGASALYFTNTRFNSSFDTRLSTATIDGGTI